MRLKVQEGPAPSPGATVFAGEIASDPALVAPLVMSAVDYLREQGLFPGGREDKITLCLQEALQNAVVHGNGSDPAKKVRLRLYRDAGEWGMIVSDEGHGFDPERIRDPLGQEGLWGESGRGLFIISHFMERVEYYNGGSTVLMAKQLAKSP